MASGVDVAQSETGYQQARADVASNTTTATQYLNTLNLLAGQSVNLSLLPERLDTRTLAVTPVAAAQLSSGGQSPSRRG